MNRVGLVVLAFALLAGSACGKYGPPVRTSPSTDPAAKPAPVSAAPISGDTEECADPEAAKTAGATP
jgi:hypothetical protein